jgi:hypothetical protein
MENLVFIKPRNRASALKMHEMKDDQGRLLGKYRYSNTNVTICAPYHAKTGMLKTGLDKLVDNPYRTEKGIKDNVDPDFHAVLTGDKIKLQHSLEIKYGLPFNTLHNQAATPQTIKMKTYQPSYIQNFKLMIPEDGLTLNLDRLDDEIAYYICLESKHVANSVQDLNEHKWPESIFYISYKKESNEVKYQKFAREALAMSLLMKDDKTDIVLNKLAVILGLTNNHASLREDSFTIIMDFIKSGANATSSENNMERFIKEAELLNSPKGKQEFEMKYLLQKGVDYRVIQVRKTTYTWLSQNTVIGINKADAVGYLMDKANTDNVKLIESEIEAMKKL